MRMRALAVASLAFAAELCSPWVYAQVCTPALAVGRQFRGALGHRTSGASPGRRTSVAEILRWSAPVNVSNDATRIGPAAVDPRENNRYTLDGDAWRVSLDSADCGLVAELADIGEGPGSPRVIVVVPLDNAFRALREALIAALPHGRIPTRGGRVDLHTPIRIRATGFAFFNGASWSPAHPQTGTGHGTSTVGALWEIRPVQQLTVLSNAPTLEAPVPVAQDLPSSIPVPGHNPTPDAGTASRPHHDHIRCCDGTVSPACLCDREDFRGCCVHHGGICGGCGE